MATVVEPKTAPTLAKEEPGFSAREGANWSDYLAFRPVYPKSFFNHIYEYHFQKPQAVHSVAHDVGAGCGIVSSSLASRFDKVIVSDPNDGYTALARKLLVEQSGLGSGKFTFLQEGAEKSSAGSGTVDLVTACEMMHWTDTAVAIKEFNRVLKVGGSLAVTYYTVPRIVGNDAAEKIWRAIWLAYAERAQGELYDHAFGIVNSAFQSIGLPEDGWERVKRVYINTGGSLVPFQIDDRLTESRVREDEEAVWVEGDKDWYDVQGLDWLKGYLATWVPRIPESDIQGLWDGLDAALNGKPANLETPLVLIFATKKA
ncbi:S-adenosyl-L-methionine-dependent methyltransferase [Lasiosphaeria hispida]|uniref:S-adenosyl-L-methionine-dependent methyltransferase n=1 Tax=Lasiosphaeria hispida TaxID=260671 RepID=A0AAJ0H5J0_9PEZI|nr:S-adenosyl-L-methionine-dependent methyltransferase [Lasiosphaeria hispida]